jgi:hypothetical protein
MEAINILKPTHGRLLEGTPTHLLMREEQPVVVDIPISHDKIQTPHFPS